MNVTDTEKIVKVRAHVIVAGLVQGVFFRFETRRVANAQGVTGWIRNLPDDRVEAVFEGEEEYVKRVLDFCRKGARCGKDEQRRYFLGKVFRRFRRFSKKMR